ncbi:hypothetical protein GCM10007298_44740 [Williamsia phyllosphaerae]|uniref:Secreted protein n=1 Tax=Williamsia phyllosphaerae TaxID=885042 RepID=A0ABQ1V8J3_9NOCA|nr:hypothetical protein GCM10007298_44740 [Williamsia phyllosphaerae]
MAAPVGLAATRPMITVPIDCRIAAIANATSATYAAGLRNRRQSTVGAGTTTAPTRGVGAVVDGRDVVAVIVRNATHHH